jgi:hypothetical protein
MIINLLTTRNYKGITHHNLVLLTTRRNYLGIASELLETTYELLRPTSTQGLLKYCRIYFEFILEIS